MSFLYFKLLFLIPALSFCTGGGVNSGPTIQNGEQIATIPELPSEISFAGEAVPLNYFDVRESLQREMTVITYWHSSMILIFQNNNRYKREIMKILKEEGVPEDFYYLCIAESGLQPVSSYAGACGYWQFLAATAKEYGLVVDDEVDERYNIEKSTRAAAAYFKKAYTELGSWTLAAASYNIGLANVKYRKKIQFQNNYYDMQFPEETGRYVFRALAFKTIMSDPGKYGYNLDKGQLYPEFDYKEVTVNTPIENWSAFAAKHRTNFKLLKMYNQWIRANNLTNKNRNTFIVRIPKEGTR
ncbi:MAG: lytic transglycosylase domain-containing protein [Bacteroidales bacterium]|nr:lytic transglycosylase domain-containing protein [Bacteroidales bacterium]